MSYHFKKMLQAFKDHDDTEVFRILSENKNPEVDGVTILTQLIKESVDIFQALTHGIDPNGTAEYSDAPIFEAINRDGVNLSHLVFKGANINAVNSMGFPVIFKVKNIRDFDLLRIRNVNLDVRVEGLDSENPATKTNLYDYVKNTHSFSEEYRQHVIKYFTERDGYHIIRSIKTQGNKVVVLINKEPYTSVGLLLIHSAVNDDDIPYAKALLKSGANPNAYYTRELLDMQGLGLPLNYETPLHRVKSVEMLDLLLKYGAYIDGTEDSTRPILNSVSMVIFDAFADNDAIVKDGDEEKVEERMDMIAKINETKTLDFNFLDSFLSRIRAGEPISNASLARHYLSRDIRSLSSKHSQVVISHGNMEEKSLLEHVLEQGSRMRDVVDAINLGADPKSVNSSGRDLLSMNIDDYLRVKICVQQGIGSISEAKKCAIDPRIIEYLSNY